CQTHSDLEQVPLVYKRNRHDGVSGAPFRTTPVVKSLNTLACGCQTHSDLEQVPLVYKRNRHDGVSGAPFRTTPVVKSLNRRACGYRRIIVCDNVWMRVICISD
ncbi:MAG: hypothetical protein LBL06_05930, partial [Treponema sp.]|nr:hypothetical protein [Treponema sp.]